MFRFSINGGKSKPVDLSSALVTKGCVREDVAAGNPPAGFIALYFIRRADDHCDYGCQLTLDEAERLVSRIQARIAAAKEELTGVRGIFGRTTEGSSK